MTIRKGISYSISRFVCPDCLNEFPIPRMENRRRGKKHVKDLWCPYCKKVKKTIEIRDFDFYKNYYGEEII